MWFKKITSVLTVSLLLTFPISGTISTSFAAPTQSQPSIAAGPANGEDEGPGTAEEGGATPERRSFGHDQRKGDPYRHIEEDHEGGIEEIQIALVGIAVILAALLAYRAGRRKGRKNSAE